MFNYLSLFSLNMIRNGSVFNWVKPLQIREGNRVVKKCKIRDH